MTIRHLRRAAIEDALAIGEAEFSVRHQRLRALTAQTANPSPRCGFANQMIYGHSHVDPHH